MVLVIEDNPDWMRRLIRLCKSAGYSTKSAPSLNRAIVLLQSTVFDAVVADLRLSEWESGNVDGLRALDAVPDDQRPATLVVTGHPDPGTVRAAFRDYRVVD